MVTDELLRRLRKLSDPEKNTEVAAAKAGMDPATARRYLRLERLPRRTEERASLADPGGPVQRGVGGGAEAD